MTTKVHKATMQQSLRVNVHDGVTMHIINISMSDSHLTVLEKTAQAMRRPNNLIEIGYEAPWSSKIGTKKNLAYISSKEELDEFWLAYGRYVDIQRLKKRCSIEEVACEITFRNMLDSMAVLSVLMIILLHTK